MNAFIEMVKINEMESFEFFKFNIVDENTIFFHKVLGSSLNAINLL